MKPYYNHGGITLYHGDCREVLPALGTFDVTITDPPYAEKTHAGARTTRPGVRLTTAKLVNFESMSDAEFLETCQLLVGVTRRWVVMSCDWRHSAAAECGGLPVVRCGVWVKPNAAPQFSGDRPGTGWEAVLILHRPGKKRWNGGGHHAVWTCNIEPGPHPTMKPEPLLRQWVSLFSEPGECILDPFAGSGTTLRAAKDIGRRAVGIELEERYCEIAAKRLSQEVFTFPEENSEKAAS